MPFFPDVDVVIAVHDPRRPILRAVSSVLDHNRASLRVTVVCHNTAEGGIRDELRAHAGDERLRLIELHDGIRSPAGPFNAGLDAADARFTSVMGSDDELEPGAIDSWLAMADRDRAAAVIPRLRHATGRAIPTPPVRPFRSSNLDAVKDRLAYRSAPLGLVSRRAFGSDRFVPGLSSGEDVAYVTGVWFSGERISFDRRGPAYLVHSDAADRVSGAKAVAEDIAFLRLLADDPRFARLSDLQRRALIVKLVRVHIFGVVENRPEAALWTQADRRLLAEMTASLLSRAPGAHRTLSRADNALLAAIQNPDVPVAELLRRGVQRRRFLRLQALLPADLRQTLAREAPLRMMAASALVRGVA